MKIPFILPILISFVLGSCASSSSSSTEPLLSAAGFRVKTPETAEQRALYEALPSYQVQRGTHKGEVFYAYKDEEKGLAFVGNEDAYQQYQKLALERKIARDQYDAAVMNEMTATRWHGAYYGYPYRPGYRRY